MSERRFDPVTGEWRTFATHRQERTFFPPAEFCPLCPTTDESFPTEVPRDRFDVVVFDNKFPSFRRGPPEPDVRGTALHPVAPARGAAEVVVYSDEHDCTLADLGRDRIRLLVEVWADRYRELGARDEVDYVFVFENKGEAVGVTLHHPHGQIYAYPEIPPRVRQHLNAATAHIEAHGTCVVCDVVARESGEGTRIVADNRSFVAFVPFAARYPYEVHVTARRHATSLLDLTDVERDALADLLEQVIRGYDALYGFSMPYVMSMHQAPTDGSGSWLPVSHFHIEFTPPHRTETKLKYIAGSELGAGAWIVDAKPEDTAGELRAAVERAAAPV